MITIRGYGNYKSDNYGKNALHVQIGSIQVWFSYSTVVAITDGVERYVTENVWGPTTGKHLNWIQPDKKLRIPFNKFEGRVSSILTKYGLKQYDTDGIRVG